MCIRDSYYDDGSIYEYALKLFCYFSRLYREVWFENKFKNEYINSILKSLKSFEKKFNEYGYCEYENDDIYGYMMTFICSQIDKSLVNSIYEELGYEKLLEHINYQSYKRYDFISDHDYPYHEFKIVLNCH